MSRILGRWAAGAPVPVFAVAGAGARETVQDLRLDGALRLVDSPREANVLLLAGAFPERLGEPLRLVHDAMSPPRCTVVWAPAGVPGARQASVPGALTINAGEDIAATIVRAHRELVRGERASEPALLPDVEPAPWRGVGPYGQGGSGMTGGTPYGRPLAELVDDRDGLRLDALPSKVGPFFAPFPPGLVLDAALAGDLIVEAAIESNPFADLEIGAAGVPPGLRPFVRALSEPVSIAELELARARAHLRWCAGALSAHGLAALGCRALELSGRVRPADVEEVRHLERLLRWTQVFRWSTRGVGRTDRERLVGMGVGPVARAASLAEDVRLDDPAYRALGFEPVVHDGADAAARWRQRLAEAAQALDLAARAGERRTEPRGRVEGPRGRIEPGSAPTARLLELVPELVTGREWGDAVATIVSLDLDLEEAAIAEQLRAGALGR